MSHDLVLLTITLYIILESVAVGHHRLYIFNKLLCPFEETKADYLKGL